MVATGGVYGRYARAVADVRPFRAVRYARPTTTVTAPPYDVIDEASRTSLAARDPHNVVHLTLDDADVAGARYRSWLDGGVLVRDTRPAVWWLEQDFVGPDGVARSRSGSSVAPRGAVRDRHVLPHERTHAGPIEGRLRLLRATRAQLKPIFLLHEGRPPLVRLGLLTSRSRDAPLARRGRGRRHAFFESKQAPRRRRHHRYETAMAFAAEDGADRLMAVLVSTADPAWRSSRPTRVFYKPEIDPPGERLGTLDEAFDALAREPDDVSAAVFLRGGEARLVRGEEDELDVELVGRFGHEEDRVHAGSRRGRRWLLAGLADCAFVLRPLRIEDVFEQARAGRTLPPKATYFFPKLVSGLLFHPVDP